MHLSPSPAEEAVAAEVADVRPSLGPSYAAALDGARAAVLTRLWRALAFEPLPWVVGRAHTPDGLALRLAGVPGWRARSRIRTRPSPT